MVGAKETGEFYDHEYHCKSKRNAGQCPPVFTGTIG